VAAIATIPTGSATSRCLAAAAVTSLSTVSAGTPVSTVPAGPAHAASGFAGDRADDFSDIERQWAGLWRISAIGARASTGAIAGASATRRCRLCIPMAGRVLSLNARESGSSARALYTGRAIGGNNLKVSHFSYSLIFRARLRLRVLHGLEAMDGGDEQLFFLQDRALDVQIGIGPAHLPTFLDDDLPCA
jgi:hypothetical protein